MSAAAPARVHLLQGVLRRLASSPHVEEFLLRGGLLMQLWVGPGRRATRDLDLVGLYPLDVEATARRLEAVLAAAVQPDGVSFALDSLRGGVIWPETDFPGVRFFVEASLPGERAELQIDVGFGDPIVPPAVWVDYPSPDGPPARVRAVTPELMTAWKLDGLFDHGPKRWQGKDLYDLYLLTSRCPLDVGLLSEGIRVAFEAHADPLEAVPGVLYDRSWWEKESSRARWEKFRAAAGVPVPADLVEVAAAVARALRPALGRLIALPVGGEWP
jgi:hypothetical protein